MKNSFEKQPEEKKESGPSFRVVGGAGEGFKNELKKLFGVNFSEGHLTNMSKDLLAGLKKNEFPKTPEELELISFANEKTNELTERAGAGAYDIPDKNIHIVSKEFYGKIDRKKSGSAAAAFREYQAVFFDESVFAGDNIYFGSTVFHELMHMKSAVVLEAEETGKDARATIYRTGFSVQSSQKSSGEGKHHEHFLGLDEAIVASEEKEYTKEMMNLPMFEEERKWMDSEKAKKIKEDIASRAGIPTDEIYWINGKSGKFFTHSYYPQRTVLNFVREEIQKEFPEKYESVKDVSDEFLKSFFSGSLSVPAQLMEKTFGKGSFRVLGIMGDDKNSAINVLETLKSMRRASETR